MPLIVFGPGYDIYWRRYLPLLSAWTRQEYVVAVVVFPLTNPGAPGGVYRPDILNQPADMAAAASGGEALANQAGSWLFHRINTHELVLAGQSDGGTRHWHWLITLVAKCTLRWQE